MNELATPVEVSRRHAGTPMQGSITNGNGTNKSIFKHFPVVNLHFKMVTVNWLGQTYLPIEFVFSCRFVLLWNFP